MKYLEITDEKGYFRRGEEMIEIDQITASDLYGLINHAHKHDFEVDEYDATKLPNKAQQIIYESIYLKLTDFLKDKEQFNDQANNLYVEAIGKYGADLVAEPEPEADDVDEDIGIGRIREDMGQDMQDIRTKYRLPNTVDIPKQV